MTGRSIAEAFSSRASRGQAALVPYVTAGYPGLDDTGAVLDALADAGGDVLELGIPFSDPLADGPTIQRSSFESLENGTTVARVLQALRDFRGRRDTPVVLFTYLNPVLRYGFKAFLADAVDAGAQGLLLTDLPTGADPDLEEAVPDAGLDLIRLVAPTTAVERIGTVATGGGGFVYYISRTGVTGERQELSSSLADEVANVRSVVDLPVAAGFGIATPDQAAQVAGLADGVVVGSGVIKALGSGGVDGARDFIASLRRGMDGD